MGLPLDIRADIRAGFAVRAKVRGALILFPDQEAGRVLGQSQPGAPGHSLP